MKVSEWTFWNDDRFKDTDELSDKEWEEATNAVIEEIRTKGYKLTGLVHQNSDHGCPVIDGQYVYGVSMRSWGSIMQRAYNLPNKDGLGYIEWAWKVPENEEMIIPE